MTEHKFEDNYKEKKILVLTVGCINYDHDINHYEPIKFLFPNTVRYNYYERTQQIGRNKMNIGLLGFVKQEIPEYVFYIPYQNQIKDDTLDKIGDSGSKVVTWFCDDRWRFNIYSRFVAKHISCSITTDRESFEKYKKLGFNVILSQWAANQHYYKKIPADVKYGVTFVGQNYGKRREFIDFLKNQKIPIQAFGKGFGNYLKFEEIISIFNQSKINLSFSGSSLDDNVKQIKGRVFEVPMSGGFLLTEYADGLEEYFKIGKEIECFKDKYELIEKIRYYLEHENKRIEIANAGYIAAIERHTWEKRLTDVFNELKNVKKYQQLFQKKPIISRIYDTIYEKLARRNVSK